MPNISTAFNSQHLYIAIKLAVYEGCHKQTGCPTPSPHHIAWRIISYNRTEWPYSSMQLRSLRRNFSGMQLKFWIGLILHMLHYKMACIHSLVWLMTTPLHPQTTHKPDIIIFDRFQRRKKTHRLTWIEVFWSAPALFYPTFFFFNIYVNQGIGV